MVPGPEIVSRIVAKLLVREDEGLRGAEKRRSVEAAVELVWFGMARNGGGQGEGKVT